MLSAALATKLFAAPLLIGLASLAGKRWGPGLSGLLGGLPLVGAPVVLALWLTDGPALAHQVARTAPIGVWATMVYLLVFGYASARFAWAASLGISWLCYLTVAALLHYTQLDQLPWLGFLILPMLLWAATRLLPQARSPAERVRLPPQELVARLLAAVTLVALLTTAAQHIGPDFTGVLSGAPVAATVIPIFTFATAGRDALLRALRGFLTGLMGFAVFFLVLAALMPTWGSAALAPSALAALAASWLGSLLVQGFSTGVYPSRASND